ncbi:MAG: glutamate--tRNA ligase [Actinobacteria bacterium]|nr:glutamate--tRNA ligase [Actinomycetota bacterium]
MPRLRFAPSPTGGLHIGTARTALFNWIAAKSMGGKLILRIEDTDIKRSTREYEALIIEDLKWLGIGWDEFYRQSERIGIYQKVAERLLEERKAYRCFCSPQRLSDLRDTLLRQGKVPKYDGKCRYLTQEEIKKKLEQKQKFVIRFVVENEERIGDIEFNDLIRGVIRFSPEAFGDFIIIKSDGTPSYNFAVVVDDSDMKITHVLRGEDHITNTARQLLLFKALGYKIPYFAHFSMILARDGSKLSKRHGATTISEFREMGYLSEAIVNYLSILSWNPMGEEEIFALQDVVDEFRFQDISKSPAIFDIDKLNWINGIYIRKKTCEELFELCTPFLIKSGIIGEKELENEKVIAKIKKCIDAFKDNLKVLGEFPDRVRDFFSDKIDSYEDSATEVLKAESSLKVVVKFMDLLKRKLSSLAGDKSVDLTEEEGKNIIKSVADELKNDKIKGKALYMPIRASITGKTHGPELPKVIAILGIEDCIKRVEQTLTYLNNL